MLNDRAAACCECRPHAYGDSSSAALSRIGPAIATLQMPIVLSRRLVLAILLQVITVFISIVAIESLLLTLNLATRCRRL